LTALSLDSSIASVNARAAQPRHAAASLRPKLLSSWSRHENGYAIRLTHEQAAGYLLAQHGHARAAIAQCPTEGWWDPVFRMLIRVLEEECA
jgi:hypothetical protein